MLPLIRKAKKYIYIPTFVLTEKRVTEELIKAKQRGVDVRIIIDALNASIKHSKHRELRFGGILLKTENYAGKMHSKSMIIDEFDNDESKQVKILKRDEELKVDLMTINDEEFENLFKSHQELFDKIDNLID